MCKKKYTIEIDGAEYRLTPENHMRCQKCAFHEKPLEFCLQPEIKCLTSETGGVIGNYQKALR